MVEGIQRRVEVATPVVGDGPNLTDEQRRIVEWGDGPLVVIAGAGTGKTRVIVERVRHLLETREGLQPENLLVLTYNVKAAGELRTRIEGAVGLTTASRIAISNSTASASGSLPSMPTTPACRRGPTCSTASASCSCCASSSRRSGSSTTATTTGRSPTWSRSSILRARGVSTTTFGVGTDFDESLLQAMADAGGGHFYYIADAAQIRDHIASEVGETLEVVAQHAELEVLAGEGVEVDTLSPHPISARGTRSIVGLGDLVADQTVVVVLRLTFPYGQLGRETGIIVRALDREGVFEAAGVADARLTWTWADDRANDEQPRDVDVDRAVARQFAARARQEAVARNRTGDFDGAQRVLEGTAKRIRRHAGRDRVMRAL